MIETTCGEYTILIGDGELPSMYWDFKGKASLVHEKHLYEEGEIAFLGVKKGISWPFLLITLRYNSNAGFSVGTVLVPENDLLFVGGDENIWIFDLNKPELILEDTTFMGFWGWERYNDEILMRAELEFAAWSLSGEKLWSRFVEPPWDFNIEGEEVELDIMGKLSRFNLKNGPLK